jgi:glutaredoxin
MEIIKFEKKGCIPCFRVSAILDEHEVDFKSIDIMNPENGDLLEEYDIFSVPVTFLLDDNGKVVKEITGVDEDSLLEMISIYKN